MTTFSFLTINDIHICNINPRSRIDNFKETILGKLEQVRIQSIKLKIDAVLLAGDLFNFKNPNKNSHEMTRELIELFKKFECPVYMIPGNHDMTGNSLDSLDSQPLGVLFASGAVIQLKQEIIEKDGLRLSLIGVPYIENLDLAQLTLPKEDAFIQICLMHIYAGPHAGMLFKEKLYGYPELATLGPDIFVIGHYHVDQGIQELNGTHFINLGSLSRGTISEENINHHPKMGHINIEMKNGSRSIQINEIPLKIKPAEEVFDLKKREEEKREATEIQEFVDKLVNSTTMDLDENKNIVTILDQMDLAREVREKTLSFIQEAALK